MTEVALHAGLLAELKFCTAGTPPILGWPKLDFSSPPCSPFELKPESLIEMMTQPLCHAIEYKIMVLPPILFRNTSQHFATPRMTLEPLIAKPVEALIRPSKVFPYPV